MSIPTVPVTCTAYDQNGNPVAGAVFTARLSATETYQGFVVPELYEGTANDSGVCVINLFPNALGVAGSSYLITATNPDTGKKFLKTTAVVPNSACNLHQIVNLEPAAPLDAAEQAILEAQAQVALASAQAGIATTKASEASASASTATTQAGISTTKAGEASTSATTASTQAGIATTKAGEAASSASAASNSAGTATTQAGIATTQAGIATTKAGEASTSATTATTKAGEASTSASNAATSAQTATTKASEASASASTATTQAGIATTKAEEAHNSAVSSYGSAQTATTKADLATAKASDAGAYAQTATTQAGIATTKADEASVSAGTATTQAGIATTKANEASASAATATTQTNTATTKANESSASAAAALASQNAAATSATNAAASAVIANTKAGEASGSAANALAIYGNTAAMNTAVSTAQAQASLAAGYAASAGSVAQQDLSAVSSTLHRSPTAITSLFVYDISKDSDGGAWTEKCQHTSWYNETIYGKWLGAQDSEVGARGVNATATGPELIVNGNFSEWTGDSPTGWSETVGTNANVSKVGDGARFLATSGATAGRPVLQQYPSGSSVLYKIVIDIASITSGTVKVNTTYIYDTPGIYTIYSFGTGVDIRSNSAAPFDFVIRSVSVREAIVNNTDDYYQLTTDGKFYKLNAGSGVTEVFRGNKRAFPKLAAIVAEATSVTIYDLTEAGRPMFCRFIATANATVTSKYLLSGANALAAVNGKIYVGGTATNATGLTTIDFAKDMAQLRLTSGYTWNGKLSTRNTVGGYTTVDASVGAIVNATANAVATTILPDAPIDPATGLKVPTIAVGTGGGLSLIQNTGTVRNSSSTLAFTQVTLTPQLLSAGRADAVWYYAANPGSLGASFALTTKNASTATDFNVGNTALLKAKDRKDYARTSGAVVQLLRTNEGTIGKGTAAKLSDTYNTGWLAGDIRRAYLASNVVGSVTGPELVTNGTFDTGTTGWEAVAVSQGSSISAVGGKLAIVGRGAKTSLGSGFIPGKTYKFTFYQEPATPYLHTYCAVKIGYSENGAEILNSGVFRYSSWGANTYNYYVIIPASYAGQTVVVTFSVIDATGDLSAYTTNIDNVSFKEVIPDRSYKAAGANIAGTLTATAVNTGNDLVAYSGFSAANYIREPYSADLDFGTDEWSCSAWLNTLTVNIYANFWPELNFSGWTNNTGTVVTGLNDPYGGTNAWSFTATGGTNRVYRFDNSGIAGPRTFSIDVYGSDSFSIGGVNSITSGTVDPVNGTVSGSGNTITAIPGSPGWYRLTCAFNYSGATGNNTYAQIVIPLGKTITFHGQKYNSGSVGTPYVAGIGNVPAPVVARGHSSGPSILLGVDGYGRLVATAYDGTTTRTATTSAVYNTATWLKARANYTTDGTLAILVNGVEVASTTGTPLLTLNNSNAVLTIGNAYALDAPFPGSICLLKFSASIPTQEQATWMYEQEKQLFTAGAKCVLPASTSVLDLAYDDATDTWSTLQATHESTFSGLVRTSTQAPSAGSFSKSTASSGVKLLGRTTTNPGVDVQIPAKNLKAELARKREVLNANQDVVVFDYFGGFTATTTTGSTALTSVASSLYPSTTNLIGCAITGTGIPASTVITGISGTTIYMSKAATANGSAIQISTTDFNLPVGYTARAVMTAGTLKREGSTADYTKQFDGFKETIRYAVAPGYNAWVQLQAVKEVM